MAKHEAALHVVAVDCCEHTLAALENVPTSHLVAVASKSGSRLSESGEIDVIIIGVAKYPVRRPFVSQLRRVYPDVPMLLLRRDDAGGQDDTKECIRGEFILADDQYKNDLEIVRALRLILPLPTCTHTHKGQNYDTVRKVIHVIAEKYADPDLDLDRVAKELPMSPKRLSRVLNQQVGISFRQLLRHTRIEEAKRILASRQYSVKEVAARVGFSDSHYFSRSFKELTGQSASEYKSHTSVFN